MSASKCIVFCSILLVMVQQSYAVLPAYSLTIVEKCLTDLAVKVPAFRDLSTLLLPFLANLLSNLNNLSNIVQNLTPALLPYFGCTLPLLNSALSDVFSVLILYVGTAVSLFNSGLLLGPGIFGLVATILKAVLALLQTVADPAGILITVIGEITNVLAALNL